MARIQAGVVVHTVEQAFIIPLATNELILLSDVGNVRMENASLHWQVILDTSSGFIKVMANV